MPCSRFAATFSTPLHLEWDAGLYERSDLGISIWQVPNIGDSSVQQLTCVQVNNKHPIIGIVVFLALLFQPVLGILHHLGFKRHGRRTFISHLHIWIGRIMITLGIVNGGLGLLLAANSRSGEIIYAVVAAVFWFTWMFAACFGEVRRLTKRRHHHREKGSPTGHEHVRDIEEPVAAGARAPPATTKTTDAYA
jgi:hypothetical protein